MARYPADLIETARARGTLMAGDAPARVAGRRGRGAAPAVVRAMRDPMLLALADESRRHDIIALAAAAFHAEQITRAISSAERSEMAQIITDKMRRFAVAQRKYADPSTRSDAFGEAFADTKMRIADDLAALMKGVPPDSLPLRRCLEAALAEGVA